MPGLALGFRLERLDLLSRRLLQGISWTTAGNFVSSASSMLSAVLLARVLGPGQFGEFGAVQNTIGYFGVLVGPSLGMTATRYVAQLRYTDPARMARILKLITVVTASLALALALLLFLLSPWVAAKLFKAPGLLDGFRAGAAILLLMAVNGVQMGALTGFEAFRAAAMVNIGRGFATLPALYMGGALFGPAGALWGLAASWLVACILGSWFYRRVAHRLQVPRRALGICKEAKILLDFSTPGWIGGVLAGLANALGILVLSRQSQGMAQIGILNASNQLFLVLMFLPQIVNQVALPILSERSGQDRTQFRTLFRRLIFINLGVTLPLVLGLSFVSPFLMKLFGPRFASGWPVLVLTLWAVPAYAMALLAQTQLTALGRMWGQVLGNTIYFSTFVGGNWVFANEGAAGFAIARIVSFLLMFGFLFFHINRTERFRLGLGGG